MRIRTVEPDEATGGIAAVHQAEIAASGRVMEATRRWSARPDMLVPVEDLLHRIRDGFSLGLLDFRPVTFVAARCVPSSYCSHVHFRALSGMVGRDRALAVRRDYRNAGLGERQVEMLAYAERIGRDASKITEAEIARLREVGLSDLNIADIALAAAFRSFMSRHFDAGGAEVEADLLEEDPEVREEMSVGRKQPPLMPSA
jgi:alkylhydroperoxidase family enzyme